MTSTTSTAQRCTAPGCDRPAAFRTLTKATWCDEHITAILRQGGLEPLEPFPGSPTKWRLTRCLTCGCQAHYRLEYSLTQNAADQPTCRACYWRTWAADVRALQGPHARLAPVAREDAAAKAEQFGYDYLGPLTTPSLPDDPHHVRCRYCGRLSAERLGDIGWGCSCQVNPRRDAPRKKGPRVLFKDADLAAVDWWDHENNPADAWATVTPKARREVAWRCPDCGTRFTARVLDMTNGPECPDCEPRRRAAWDAAYETYQHTPITAVPELAAAWADDADPAAVLVAGDWRLRRFRCPNGHHPRLSPLTYLQSGCPHCRGQRTTEEKLAALTLNTDEHGINPEIASQWHPSKNGTLRLDRLSPGSRRTVWWYEPSCGHEWQATPAEREKRQRLRCPECRTILDSLAYHFPALAAEWAPDNPRTAWQVRPTATVSFLPRWICTTDSAHTWHAPLPSRTSGSGCPMCKEAGKSAIELRTLDAARARFGNATSGQPLRDPAFTARTVWHPDIIVTLPTGRRLIIEYDGSYWHADKTDVDAAKTRDLLAAGHLVARLREHPLPPLPVSSPAYLEVTVYSLAPDPDLAVGQIAAWASDVPTDPAEAVGPGRS